MQTLNASRTAQRIANRATGIPSSRLPRRIVSVHASSSPQAQEASADYKRAAAKAFVDEFVTSGYTVAFGSGELVNLAIEEVGKKLAAGQLEGVTAVPACDAAAHEAAFHGVPVAPASAAAKVSVLVEQVDMVDLAANAAIKGVASEPQQPQLPRLRSVMQSATRTVVLAEADAVVERLRGTLPVVVEEDNWEETAEELDDTFIGDAEIWRRAVAGTGPADPRGGDHPYTSPEGHNILDIKFDANLVLFSEEVPYADIAAAISDIPGVVTHGLLLGAATSAVIARREGGPKVTEFVPAGPSSPSSSPSQ